MSYTCLLMVLCECACANLVSKANFNLINRTDLFICLHIMFQISFQNSKGQKSSCKFFGVWAELLLSIFVVDKSQNQVKQIYKSDKSDLNYFQDSRMFKY